MSTSRRLLRACFCCLLFLASTTACTPPPSTTIPGCPAGRGEVACDSDRACPGGVCERADPDDRCGLCRSFTCVDDSNCLPGTHCDIHRTVCEPDNQCPLFGDEGSDDGDGCAAPSVCAPAAADERCVIPVASACEVVPAVVFAVDGDVVDAGAVEVLVLDDQGRPLPLTTVVTLPSSLSLPTDPSSPSSRLIASCAGPAACVDDIAALVGEREPPIDPVGEVVRCTGRAIVLPRLQPGELRVVARDIDTGAPLVGASVELRASAGPGLPPFAGDAFEGVSDDDGVFIATVADGDVVDTVRIDAAGYASTALVAPGAADVEVLLARSPVAGDVSGAAFDADLSRTDQVGDIHVGIASLSTPDLVGALDEGTLLGTSITQNVRLEGLTPPEGSEVPHPLGSVVSLGTTPLFQIGVARSRAGARLVSVIASNVSVSDLFDLFSTAIDNRPDAAYDFMLGLWLVGVHSTSFGVAGTVESVDLPNPRTIDDVVTLLEDSRLNVLVDAPLDASGEIDVRLPHLLARDDAAFVAVYARIPGRGMVLVALRFVSDGQDIDGDGAPDDSDGFIDDADVTGAVRMFIAPALWTKDRELVVVAGTTTNATQRAGRLSTDRVYGVVDPGLGRVELPAFHAKDVALVDGTLVTLPPRRGELVAIDGAGFRVYVGGALTSVDLADLGYANDDVERVWAIDAESSVSFATGPLSVARILERPRSARAIFGGE